MFLYADILIHHGSPLFSDPFINDPSISRCFSMQMLPASLANSYLYSNSLAYWEKYIDEMKNRKYEWLKSLLIIF